MKEEKPKFDAHDYLLFIIIGMIVLAVLVVIGIKIGE